MCVLFALRVSALEFGPEHDLKRPPWRLHWVSRPSLHNLGQWEERVHSASAIGGVRPASASLARCACTVVPAPTVLAAPAPMVKYNAHFLT